MILCPICGTCPLDLPLHLNPRCGECECGEFSAMTDYVNGSAENPCDRLPTFCSVHLFRKETDGSLFWFYTRTWCSNQFSRGSLPEPQTNWEEEHGNWDEALAEARVRRVLSI